uniref:Uncharacterized protein n=1 Tax=Anguilla anguilla TaxID=7936 RepID=A0A0E9XN93_ANGAN
METSPAGMELFRSNYILF